MLDCAEFTRISMTQLYLCRDFPVGLVGNHLASEWLRISREVAHEDMWNDWIWLNRKVEYEY